MPTLMLLRHAKSDWPESKSGPKMDDHDRPLSDRGIKDAPRMGAHIRAGKREPDLVLCSTSARTRETWELIAPELRSKPQAHFDRALYLAAWPQLLAIVQTAPANVHSLMLIGHNPGMEQLAAQLAAEPHGAAERERVAAMRKKFPTCALAVVEFEGAWKKVAHGTGRLVAFVRPKDLEE
jgi:phosphohistidine phosphatase